MVRTVEWLIYSQYFSTFIYGSILFVKFQLTIFYVIT